MSRRRVPLEHTWRQGASTRKHGHADRLEMRRLYEEDGWGAGQIARQFGTTSATVLKYLRDMQVDIRPAGGPGRPRKNPEGEQ